MTPSLIVGAVIALTVLLLVLLPLMRPASNRSTGRARAFRGALVPVREDIGGGGGGSAIEILREIEFDRATGKLSDADYGALKVAYTAPALAELRRAEASASTGGSHAAPDDVRRLVAGGVAVCPTCGPRPESDATYCSTCAAYLPGACAACGAPVTQPAARYCSGCGGRLAA